jgi:hypothetical protein
MYIGFIQSSSSNQEWTRESHFMLIGVLESVREWTPTLPNELSLWELESQWTFESSEGDYRGQNSLDWKVLYIIEKLLKPRCLKWACMTHLGYLKHKLWPKERPIVKLAVWLLTIKSRKSPWFPYIQVACHIPLERFQQEIQFWFALHLNRRSSHKVMGPQSCKSPI